MSMFCILHQNAVSMVRLRLILLLAVLGLLVSPCHGFIGAGCAWRRSNERITQAMASNREASVLPDALRQGRDSAALIIDSASSQIRVAQKAQQDAAQRKASAEQQLASAAGHDSRIKLEADISEAQIHLNIAIAACSEAESAKIAAMNKLRTMEDIASDTLLPLATGMMIAAERAYGRKNKEKSLQYVLPSVLILIGSEIAQSQSSRMYTMGPN